MIGQIQVQEQLHKMIAAEAFPRFIILAGLPGSGKRILITEVLCPALLTVGVSSYFVPDVKVDTVRRVEQDIYQLTNTIFIFPTADGMSTAAQNALLKMAEEVPNNNYLLLPIHDIGSVLPTIRSRGTLFTMAPYSHAELLDYCKSQGFVTKADRLSAFCQTPGEINLLANRIEEFDAFVQKVFDNVHKVSGVNAFKIGNSLNISAQSADYKWNLDLFFRGFLEQCSKAILQSRELPYDCAMRITLKYLRELNVPAVNKQMVFNGWLLDIRKEWLPYAEC